MWEADGWGEPGEHGVSPSGAQVDVRVGTLGGAGGGDVGDPAADCSSSCPDPAGAEFPFPGRRGQKQKSRRRRKVNSFLGHTGPRAWGGNSASSSRATAAAAEAPGGRAGRGSLHRVRAAPGEQQPPCLPWLSVCPACWDLSVCRARGRHLVSQTSQTGPLRDAVSRGTVLHCGQSRAIDSRHRQTVVTADRSALPGGRHAPPGAALIPSSALALSL